MRPSVDPHFTLRRHSRFCHWERLWLFRSPMFCPPSQMFSTFLTKLSSCLPRRAVGAKRLADLSYKEAFIARSRRTPAMRTIRCLRELSGRKLHRDEA